MRADLVTKGDLMAQIRKAGVDELHSVKNAYVEGDGTITVTFCPAR